MRRGISWRRLRESTEGPNVTVQLPRQWAEELMRALMTSLEIEDMGAEPDMEGEPHAEPDEDDLPGGIPDMDADDDVPAGFESDEDEEPEFKAGEPEDDDDSDKESDDDDEKDEALDFSSSDRNIRTKTALGESSFARAARLIAENNRRVKRITSSKKR